MPIRLGAKAPRVTNAINDFGQTQVLKVCCALLCSLAISLSNPTQEYYKNHTISQREVGESSTMATKLLGTTSNQQNRAWNSSPPRRGLRGINSRSQRNQPLCDSQNPEHLDSTTQNFWVFKPTSRQCHVCQIRNGFALAAKIKCAREAFCVSLNFLRLLEH